MKRRYKKISKKIEEYESDSSQLCQLVNHLTNCKMENPLPSRNTDKELADEFADYFIWKIVKIRNELDEYPIYYPSNSNVPKLSNFNELDQDQVEKS